MLASSQHAFHFGDLLISLGQQGGYADHGIFKLALLADGYEVGSPAAVVAAVESQLFDGDLEEITRYGNREMTFRVEISAADGESLAQGEKVLAAQLGRANTIRWLPPVPPVEATIYDVVTSTMAVDTDGDADIDELRCVRVYEITCTCMPFGRSEFETITPALASGGGSTVTPTVTVINDATSLTGWTATRDGAPAPLVVYAGNSLRLNLGAGERPFSFTYSPGAAISMSGTPWLRFHSQGSLPVTPSSIALSVNGGPPIRPEIIDADFSYFKPGASAISTLTFSATSRKTVDASARVLTRGIARQDAPPIIGTGRQLMRTLEVGGSAPTQSSLTLEHESTGLGAAVVYVNAEDGRGYQPPLRRFRASGGTVTTDASTMSGARSAMATGTPEVYDAPMANLAAGEYSVLARVRATGSAGSRSFTRITSPRISGTSLDPISHWTQASLSTSWQWVAMSDALVTIDPATAPSGVFRVQLESNAVDIDECLLLNVTTGSLVRVDAGASTRLWIDSPTTTDPQPRIRVGTAADGSDARHIAMDQIAEFSLLDFEVGTMNVFTACEALNAACSMRHFLRWHTYAAAS